MNRWLVAVKPMALPKLLAPTLVGLSLGLGQNSIRAVHYIVLTLFLVLFAQLAIALLNDYADRDADALHARRFPELLDARVLPALGKYKKSLVQAGYLTNLGLALDFILAR